MVLAILLIFSWFFLFVLQRLGSVLFLLSLNFISLFDNAFVFEQLVALTDHEHLVELGVEDVHLGAVTLLQITVVLAQNPVAALSREHARLTNVRQEQLHEDNNHVGLESHQLEPDPLEHVSVNLGNTEHLVSGDVVLFICDHLGIANRRAKLEAFPRTLRRVGGSHASQGELGTIKYHQVQRNGQQLHKGLRAELEAA